MFATTITYSAIPVDQRVVWVDVCEVVWVSIMSGMTNCGPLSDVECTDVENGCEIGDNYAYDNSSNSNSNSNSNNGNNGNNNDD